jgi:pSer/pThr/pTyr-binding forkhead associated (FHA) protein
MNAAVRGRSLPRDATRCITISRCRGGIDAHVVLDEHSGAARMHAVIEATSADAVTLIDLGSTPGTRVNGAPINKTLLHTGDVIAIGDTALTLEIMARPV